MLGQHPRAKKGTPQQKFFFHKVKSQADAADEEEEELGEEPGIIGQHIFGGLVAKPKVEGKMGILYMDDVGPLLSKKENKWIPGRMMTTRHYNKEYCNVW